MPAYPSVTREDVLDWSSGIIQSVREQKGLSEEHGIWSAILEQAEREGWIRKNKAILRAFFYSPLLFVLLHQCSLMDQQNVQEILKQLGLEEKFAAGKCALSATENELLFKKIKEFMLEKFVVMFPLFSRFRSSFEKNKDTISLKTFLDLIYFADLGDSESILKIFEIFFIDSEGMDDPTETGESSPSSESDLDEKPVDSDKFRGSACAIVGNKRCRGSLSVEDSKAFVDEKPFIESAMEESKRRNQFHEDMASESHEGSRKSVLDVFANWMSWPSRILSSRNPKS